jgi:hypothetical protein
MLRDCSSTVAVNKVVGHVCRLAASATNNSAKDKQTLGGGLVEPIMLSGAWNNSKEPVGINN